MRVWAMIYKDEPLQKRWVLEMEEEHGGEEGAFSELEKVNKAGVMARVKELQADGGRLTVDGGLHEQFPNSHVVVFVSNHKAIAHRCFGVHFVKHRQIINCADANRHTFFSSQADVVTRLRFHAHEELFFSSGQIHEDGISELDLVR